MEFKWLPELELGIETIDNQHKTLVHRVNLLMQAVKNPNVKDIIEARTFFIDYVFTHFKSEEAFMDIIGYPDKDAHKEEHMAFLEKIARFKNAPTSPETLKEMLDWSTDWLVNHICGTDKKIAAYYHIYNEKAAQK